MISMAEENPYDLYGERWILNWHEKQITQVDRGLVIYLGL